MSFASFAYALAAGLIPSLLWLFFFTREDSKHKKPKGLVFACFLGGMIAVLISVLAEKLIADTVADVSTRYILWAAFEETMKFFVVIVVALHAFGNEDPLDAMIYCATVALGFAAIENTLFILGPLSNGSVTQAIVTGNMRFIGATLVHVVSSGFIGFMIGYVFYHSRVLKIGAGLIGLAGAIALHSAFNLSIIKADSIDTLKIFGWVWGAVVIMIILFEELKAVHPAPLKNS